MHHIIYQVGQLSSEHDSSLHKMFAERLERAGHRVIWIGSFLSMEKNFSSKNFDSEDIFFECKKAIDSCTCVVAMLDNLPKEPAWEIGYAYVLDLPIYGIRADKGTNNSSYSVGPVEECLTKVVQNIDDLVEVLDGE